MNPTIEVAIPCLNEAETIAKTVRDFQRVLPEARVVVYDNGSTDGSADRARQAGADVRKVNRRGKGCVVRAIFEQSLADIVLMVDGDDTYEADDAPRLLQPLRDGDADMTIGTRLEQASATHFRTMHHWGNRMLTRVLNLVFRASFHDILSGYRGFSRRFLDSVPLLSSGFETDTELVIQSLELGMAVCEVPIRFRRRSPSSESKLHTLHDGYRILLTMLILLRDHRPLLVFGAGGGFLALAGATLWIWGVTAGSALRPVGVVLMAVALALGLTGLLLNTVNTRFREMQSLLRRPQRPRLDAADTPSWTRPV